MNTPSPLPAGSGPALPPPGEMAPPSAADAAPAFPLRPGETPRAFSAFLAYFQLGRTRSLAAVAGILGEKTETVKRWSSRHGWGDRLQSFNAGLLQRQADAEAASQGRQAADWARRTSEFREQEWVAGQKLLAAARCFLDGFGDQQCERMTLAQVSRAIQISASISRQALRGSLVPDEPVVSPIQVELTAALLKAYGQPPVASPEPGAIPSATSHHQPVTSNQ